MLENIEINSNFVVIGLILVALVCIYLLYTSLTSGSNNNELKQNINNLILQNKKRDEIIHFLVNQVQLLQSQPPISEVNTSHSPDNDDTTTCDGNMVCNNDTTCDNDTTCGDDEEYTVNNNINVEDMRKLDQLLDEDIITSGTTNSDDTMRNEMETLVNNDDDENDDENEDNDDVDNSENDDDDVVNDDDGTTGLVADVLNVNRLPAKDLTLLRAYTMSQLKDYAKILNISSSGNKDALVNRVYSAL